MVKPVLLWKVLSAALSSRSNQQFYDRISSIYDQVFVDHKLHADNMVKMLCQLYAGSESTTRVLDLGCGTGILSCLLADKGFDVIGLDNSLNSLRILQQREPKVSTIHGDAISLPLDDEYCHAVVSLGAWRHFTDPQKVVTEVNRVLIKDGILIVGYFPPAFGGVFHQGHGNWRRLLDRLYQLLIRKLGYTDRADLELEPQTISLLRSDFTEVETIESGANWHLIVARNPQSKDTSLPLTTDVL